MMKTEMTEIFRNNMAFLRGEEKTPFQIVQFLKDGALVRDFGHIMKQICPTKEEVSKLIRDLSQLTGEDSSSVARKVRNWMNGQNAPKNRETLFMICFSLHLTEEKACWLLGAAADTGIHYRNPVELVYAYGLRAEKSYREVSQLIPPVLSVYEEQKQKPLEETVFTKKIWDAFSHVTTEEDLYAFFQEHGKELGYLHETAYQKFQDLLDRLQSPCGVNGGNERKYTMEEVVREYIRMRVPQTKKSSGFTVLQRLIKKNWPNESDLLKMRNRKEDVSRKVMILLYLVTEAFDDEALSEDYYIVDDLDEGDGDIRLECRIEKMKVFLDSCGMNQLDPGNPFDFLALYSMKTQEEDFVSDKMAAVLDLLFGDVNGETSSER